MSAVGLCLVRENVLQPMHDMLRYFKADAVVLEKSKVKFPRFLQCRRVFAGFSNM